MNQQRMKKEFIRLTDYVTPPYFRTVESFAMGKAPGEISVKIEIKDAFRNKLSFPVSWDGILYAYALETTAVAEFRASHGYDLAPRLLITLEDWDDRFCLTAEYDSDPKRETSFFVAQDDVLYLLENCRRIPSQRLPK